MTERGINPLIEPGCWAQRLTERDWAGKPAVFLDRDGVIVEETNYLGRPEDVRMIAGVADAIAALNAAGMPVVVVTNQAGVGRGYYGWEDFARVQDCIASHLAAAGAHLDAIMACAYHHEAHGVYRAASHSWRKPAPGMLIAAAGMLGLDLSGSMLVGDTITDLEAAKQAGLKRASFVLTGHGTRDKAMHPHILEDWRAGWGFTAEIHADAISAIRAFMASRTARP